MLHFQRLVVVSIEVTVDKKRDVRTRSVCRVKDIEDSDMETNVEEWIIVALYCDTAPEFRSVQKTFDAAYSGPEQRRRMPYLLHKYSDHRLPPASSRADTALAA